MSEIYQLQDVTKTYMVGKVPVDALNGLSLSIREGEFAALQGPSGSGKSTLLNVVGLIEKPTRGSILFRGADVTGAKEGVLTDLRQRYIGFIFQSFNLIPVLSALENVEYALYLEQRYSRGEVRERAMRAIQDVGLERFATHRPAELSGGQRQRVAIARALVKDPRIIIADEPTANLDSKTAAQILELVRNLKEKLNTTILVATHDKAIADMAERIIKIKDGRIDEN
ncbi:ABC transporter ATP-binding protein [bacterium]|nr:ABC transporter ATP-binding protein [bacterium]